MARSSLSLAATALGAALLAAPSAGAFCRTSSCPNVGTASVCVPATPSDCGVPLAWPSPCVGFSMQKDASVQLSLDAATALFQHAFDVWTSADCGGGQHPLMKVEDAGPVTCARHEYNQALGNANIILFRDAKWPYAGSGNTLALTTVTYNLDDGQIYDADMELNTAQIEFTTGSTGVKFDLPSIAQHETGHFLGLAHSANADATMFPDYKPGSIALRNPTRDDDSGICAVYPPGAAPASCDITPRHGFSQLCADQQKAASSSGTSSGGGGCWLAAAGTGSTGPGAGALGLAGLLALAARRRSRRSVAGG